MMLNGLPEATSRIGARVQLLKKPAGEAVAGELAALVDAAQHHAVTLVKQ